TDIRKRATDKRKRKAGAVDGLRGASPPPPTPPGGYPSSFRADCIERLSAIVVVIRPAVGEPMFWFVKPNCGVLKRLNASARNCSRKRLPIGNTRESETSSVCVPGAFRIPRPESPYVLGGGATKSAMSNHRSGDGSSSLPSPIRFGHDGAPLFTPVFRNTVKGRPVESVAMPLNCQFSRTGFRKPESAIAWSLPNGSAQTQDSTKRWRTSKPEGPRLWSKSVTLCGPPTAPPPEAGEPA